MNMKGPVYAPKELLARLVAFDTTSHKTNLPLVRFVEDYLAQHGFACNLVYDATGHKANMFATIGPREVRGVALSGHTDVVPVTGQDWKTDPFRLTERDGRLYGRGTTDMKGFLACVLASVPRFKTAPLKVPIHIVFSYDEEIGCVGVRTLIDQLGNSITQPRMVIVGEPTSMAVVDAHKGPVRWNVKVTGRPAHSSMAPLGVNAIAIAARLIGELERIEADLKVSMRDTRFDPPYPTLQVTSISGGTASNIIPVTCEFGFEVRALPGLDIAALEGHLRAFAEEHCLPEMKKIAPESGIELRQTNNVPPFSAGHGADVVTLALALTGSNETLAVSYATEAGLFQGAGAEAVVCGPGDIAQAHTADEWIAESQLTDCMAMLDRLADWACQPSHPA